MSTQQPTAYPSIVTGFGYSPLAPALWLTDPAGLQFRDLSLSQASGDAFIGRHLRAGGVSLRTDQLLAAKAPFAFIFVLTGRVVIRAPGRDPIELGPLDAATRFGPGSAAEFEFSHDAEIIEMKASGINAQLFGAGRGTWSVSHEAEDRYIQGEGPRSYFRYRDLAVAQLTERRIHIHIVRAVKALDGGTGWHSHSMGQLFYVLRGWANLAVERQPGVRMSSGDAMCLAPRMKHNVPGFSADYLVLEMCIPADYDTIDSPAP